MYFIGLDMGTQGVRGIITNYKGELICSSNIKFNIINCSNIEGFIEQDPSMWLNSTIHVLKDLVYKFKNTGKKVEDIKALSLDGTSGTIIFLDGNNKPLTNGIMYNDRRAYEESHVVQSYGKELGESLGYKFNFSYALPKILWIKNHRPDIYEKTKRILHQGDYILGNLIGIFCTSDYSNGLKTGYDLINKKWPDFIEKLGISKRILPKVVAPGEVIGNISGEISNITGLKTSTLVVGGCTDGYASSIASGMSKEGEFNTSLGTTITIKGIWNNIIKDKHGRIYSHLHPEGYWIVGGASNIGGKSLDSRFKKEEFDILNKELDKYAPTNIVMYPLIGKGERFPFVKEEAEGFIIGEPKDKAELYIAVLEGVGYIERLCYETIEDLGCKVKDYIFITGGGVKSKEWCQIRANILNKTLLIPEIWEAAMGAAILATSKTFYSSLTEGVENMVKIKEKIEPKYGQEKTYEERYEMFKDKCREKSYLI